MTNKEMQERKESLMEEAVKEWKEQEIGRAEFEFTCGGDSFSHSQMTLFGKYRTEIDNTGFSSFLEELVFKEVEFYENSDGVYMGEAGTVYITLEGDKLVFDKRGEQEYQEVGKLQVKVEIPKEHTDFLKENIKCLRSEFGHLKITYKRDCLVSSEQKCFLIALEQTILNLSLEKNTEKERIPGTESFKCWTNEMIDNYLYVDVEYIFRCFSSVEN